MLKKIFIICFALLLQNCAVYMAADGKHEPKIGHFNDGMSRFQVESILGAPVSFKRLPKGNAQAIYEFEAGNEPNSGRAALWLAADIFFVFLPELIGTPYELTRGETKRIKVVYDESETVINLEI